MSDALSADRRSHATLPLVHVKLLFRARLVHAGSDLRAEVHDHTRDVVDTVLGDGAFDLVGPVLHPSHRETPTDAILRWTDAPGADLVVVGTHGRHGGDRLRLGSVAEAVAGDAPCPVLGVPTRAPQAPADIAAP